MLQEECKPVIHTLGKGDPVVAVVGSVHGDEPVGRRVVEALKETKITQGTLITVVAHPCALDKGVHFIDTDLNRSFSGDASGNLEEQLARYLMDILKPAQYVLDVHSTTTDTRDVVIVTHRNKKIQELVRILAPARVVIVPEELGEGTLISAVDGAVSLEYGGHNDPYTYTSSLEGVRRVLAELGIIAEKVKPEKMATAYFEVYGTEKRPRGFTMEKGIRNLTLVEQGDVLGDIDGVPMCAEESFYPFLFGSDSYPDIMGFKARKIEEL